MPDLSVATIAEITDELLSREDFAGVLIAADIDPDGSETRRAFHTAYEDTDFVLARPSAMIAPRVATIVRTAAELLDRGGA
jgi:hypothetical protein